MTDEQVEAIRTAVGIIKQGSAKRVDADDFVVYKVGDLIRIDIKPNGKGIYRG